MRFVNPLMTWVEAAGMAAIATPTPRFPSAVRTKPLRIGPTESAIGISIMDVLAGTACTRCPGRHAFGLAWSGSPASSPGCARLFGRGLAVQCGIFHCCANLPARTSRLGAGERDDLSISGILDMASRCLMPKAAVTRETDPS